MTQPGHVGDNMATKRGLPLCSLNLFLSGSIDFAIDVTSTDVSEAAMTDEQGRIVNKSVNEMRNIDRASVVCKTTFATSGRVDWDSAVAEYVPRFSFFCRFVVPNDRDAFFFE